MKSELVWSTLPEPRDGLPNAVNDVVFSPDGRQVLVAVGNRVMVYDAVEGVLQHQLRGHKDVIYALAYSRDGKRFASGGADRNIIIWTSKCEGILKYSHSEAVQCLAYNPITQQLASGTAGDFGLWSSEQKAVQKFKVTAKVLCCGWTNDGQYVALGQFNGHISIRDCSGNEKVRIERSAPVWALAWSPPTKEPHTHTHSHAASGAASGAAAASAEGGAMAVATASASGIPTSGVVAGGLGQKDVLAVACWDQTLSFYLLSGAAAGKERALDFDPCALSYFDDGEYILLGGSDRKVSLYSREGAFLKSAADTPHWVWTVKNRPKSRFLVGRTNPTRGR